jgi:hypothetical protein
MCQNAREGDDEGRQEPIEDPNITRRKMSIHVPKNDQTRRENNRRKHAGRKDGGERNRTRRNPGGGVKGERD